ncbi:hypothetical protein P7K49_026404, partial [Saguinus oedipus]
HIRAAWQQVLRISGPSLGTRSSRFSGSVGPPWGPEAAGSPDQWALLGDQKQQFLFRDSIILRLPPVYSDTCKGDSGFFG